MKVLKFKKHLAKDILSGKKNSTWRLFDDKNLCVNDSLSFVVWDSKEEFATAVIRSIVVKTLGELENSDFDGHNSFASNEDMFERFEGYYHREISEDTEVKIVKFEIR